MRGRVGAEKGEICKYFLLMTSVQFRRSIVIQGVYIFMSDEMLLSVKEREPVQIDLKEHKSNFKNVPFVRLHRITLVMESMAYYTSADKLERTLIYKAGFRYLSPCKMLSLISYNIEQSHIATLKNHFCMPVKTHTLYVQCQVNYVHKVQQWWYSNIF